MDPLEAMHLDEQTIYEYIQIAMFVCAIIVFIALFKIPAGYGKTSSEKWMLLGGVDNRLGWFLMELPTMLILVYYFTGNGLEEIVGTVFLIVWMTHYIHRTFIFPWLIRGDKKMSTIIILMGALFNAANTYIQGRWIYLLAPENMYDIDWLSKPQFIAGVVIFYFGWITNIHSDYIIRNLRKERTDNKYYIPKGGMFKYVSAPNYMGEMLEWLGWTIMTYSIAGLVFFIWTFANLAPRAVITHRWYKEKFGEEYRKLDRKAFIPYIW